MNQKLNKNGQFAVHETQRLNKELVTITGTLTSRIESRQDYYCAFLKSPNLVDSEFEFPVIFKNQEGYYKPDLKKGTQIQLTGFWSPGKDRPSFTCQNFKFLKDPDPPTFQSLQKELTALLRPSLEKKKEWAERTDFLFKKQKDLQEIQAISKLGEHFLQAYLLTKQVFYANYQTEHLEQANFTLPSYLERISSELEIIKRHMLTNGWKEVQ